MSKFTPGPWRVAGEDKNFVYALSQSGANSFWAHVQSAGIDRITENEKAANARLIAAAPDMLEALTALLARFDDNPELSELIGRVEIERARAAIAKAEGRS